MLLLFDHYLQSICTRVIQWDTGNTQGNLYQHGKGKSCAIAFKPNRPFRLATAGKEDGKVHFHKGPPFEKIAVENGVPCEAVHVKGINSLRYNTSGTLVASVGGDKSLCIYDGTDLALKCKVEAIHTGTIYACSWAPDNSTLMTSSADGTCKLFEVSADGTTAKEKHTWKVAEHMFGKALDKAPRGGMQLGCAFVNGTPVSVSTNNQIAILPMPGGKKSSIEIMTGHNAPIGAVVFDHAKGFFYTGDSDGILCRWDLKTIQALERIRPTDNSELMYQVHGGAVSGLTILKDSQLLSVGWDDTGYYTSSAGILQSGKLEIPAQPIAVSTGTSLTAIATVNGVLLLKDGNVVSKGLLPLSFKANCICVSKDDKTIYIGGDDCKIYVYIPVGGTYDLKERAVISDGHLKPVHSLAISNDGSLLASGDVRDVCVFKTADFSPVVVKSKWCFHLQKITCLAWSPDDKYIASGGADDSMYIWSMEKKMRRIHYQFAHRGGVVGLTFKKNTSDLTIVSAGVDSCVVQWDVTADVNSKFG
jgi:WD40 repeat protein